MATRGSATRRQDMTKPAKQEPANKQDMERAKKDPQHRASAGRPSEKSKSKKQPSKQSHAVLIADAFIDDVQRKLHEVVELTTEEFERFRAHGIALSPALDKDGIKHYNDKRKEAKETA